MKRPAILGEDVAVVPREATIEMECRVDHEDCTTPDAAKSAFRDMLAASPHATAWAEVKAYVEGLEAERDDVAKTNVRMIGEKLALLARIGELEARLKEAERVVGLAEEYIIDGITTAKEQYEMNAPYPAREPGYRAALDDARAAHVAAGTWMEGKK